MERVIARGQRVPGEADGSTEEFAAWVEHALLDDLIHPQHQGRREPETESLRSSQVHDELELGWLLDGKLGRFCALRSLSTYAAARR